jgi:O-methyltransferase
MKLRTQIRNRIERARFKSIYREFKSYTMIPPQIYCDNLQLAKRVKELRGCIVECGVWRGGMIAGLCRVLGADRRYYLLDSFKGLPPAQPIDGPAAISYQQNTTASYYYDNCTAPPEFATRAMQLAGAEKFELKPGFFDKSLPQFKLQEPIALLRLDADWYESTRLCLDYLFDRVATNGLIVIDDYYAWDGCSRALHDFLSQRKATERIRTFNGSLCYLVKMPLPEVAL